jgi:hypothetical protein
VQLHGWVRKSYRKAILREFGCPVGSVGTGVSEALGAFVVSLPTRCV